MARRDEKHIVHQQMIRVIALMIVSPSLESASWEIEPSKLGKQSWKSDLVINRHYVSVLQLRAECVFDFIAVWENKFLIAIYINVAIEVELTSINRW
jgi:hypothetical protein